MKIGMQVWGSHGDIRPMLALAEGLCDHGHEVTLAITCISNDHYTAEKLHSSATIISVASPVIREEETFAATEQAIVGEKDQLKQVAMIIEQLFLPVEEEMYRLSERLCQENDLVIGHYFHYPLQTAAQKHGVAHISVTLAHSVLPSHHLPPSGLPNLGSCVNPLLWKMVRRLINRRLKSFPDRLRIAEGVAPAGDVVDDIWSSHTLNLIAVTPQLCPTQDDWPASYKVCGFFDRPNLALEGNITPAIETFISAGEPPVYITFGSLMPIKTAMLETELALLSEAVRHAGCRAIIQAPGWERCGITPSAEVHYVDAAPHAELFPRCGAVVHHGGAGTTHAVLRAGVPSVVVAHIAEQAFWGRELYRLGVAAKVLGKNDATARKIALRLSTVLGSPSIKANARRIGTAMMQENGVDTAVGFITSQFMTD